MFASPSDQHITIGQARAAPEGSPERAAFVKALAPALAAVRRVHARMRPLARLIAGRVKRLAAPKPRAPRRPRRASRPVAARKTGDPEPGRPSTRENHPTGTNERASGARGGPMPGLRHIGDILAEALERIAAGLVRP